MYPILFRIPRIGDLPTGFLVAEVAIGVLAGLLWLGLTIRKQKDWPAAVTSFVAFLVIFHAVLSYVMEGPIVIHTFGVMIILGFFASWIYLARRSKRLGIDTDRLFDLAFWMLIVGIVGSRLLFAFLNWEDFSENKLEILKVWNGGLVWYGGLIPAIPVAFWLIRRYRLPFMKVCDIVSVALMLALGVGRWACFLAGDDYGQPTDLPWGITFEHSEALLNEELKKGVSLHPTQLYMSVNALWLFFILEWIRRHARYAGTTFAMMLILYAVTRAVFIEPVRGDFVERNPGYKRHLAVPLVLTKEEGTPPLRLERGRVVRGEKGRTGKLLSDVSLPEGAGAAKVFAISDGPAEPERDPFREFAAPRWKVRAFDPPLPEGVRFKSKPVVWYRSYLPKPPDFVSTSQWISVGIVLAGIAILVIVRRFEPLDATEPPADAVVSSG